MAKQRLFPEQKNESDTRTPDDKFLALASAVMRVTKHEIDKREKAWHDHRD